MPTPSSNTPPTPPDLPPRTHSSSCPEDVHSPSTWRPNEDGLEVNTDSDATMSPTPITAPADEIVVDELTESRSTTESPRPDSRSGTDRSISEPIETDTPSHKQPEELGDVQRGTIVAPAERRRSRCDIDTTTADQDKLDDDDRRIPVNYGEYPPSMGFDYSNIRILPMAPSSYLRAGSKFHGTQQSERQIYDVQVEIKYVDLRESFLSVERNVARSRSSKLQPPCLSDTFADHPDFEIGLTEDNPTLTTYFEGEIIGNRYDFLTKHEGWGATEKIDLNHWGKFSAFRQYSKQVRKGVAVSIPNLAQRENIFMRWKEHFLVPDHRVTSLNGASFEGFYYICFNQKEGAVSGIYFHAKSEKFQQLELKHVEDRGCFSALEFR
ncbi:vacuolar import and degradation protein-domain-containing protein [Xylaria bambusicola]|uniref:vacuolar import and degradation protein-domain-containing protein n=1 Tax=Xylaria bambusicola TaxID=326684 RepID=UPI0020081F47|nr:vacuolar import and degradation protein-domain-containing protein [Xylaria bambusicola]KAI0509304.1 vacuolar import and degradation protein-domain-containing protein [Xylaria bambusicola]